MKLSLPQRLSWTQHADPEVNRLFGTATYRLEADIPPPDWLAAGRRGTLDLGPVRLVPGAEVSLE